MRTPWFSILGLGITIFSFFVFVSCTAKRVQESMTNEAKPREVKKPLAFTPLYFYVDEATGCQYIYSGNAITPRMGKNHYQICYDLTGESQND